MTERKYEQTRISLGKDGVRYVETANKMQIPVYLVALYRDIGLLPSTTPDFELTQQELTAQAEHEEFYGARGELQRIIDSFRPTSYRDIQDFFAELGDWLEKFGFDIDSLRLRFQDIVSPLPAQVYETSSVEMYLLYKSIGLRPKWVGEGDAPTSEEEA